MNDSLVSLFSNAISAMCESIDSSGRGDKLAGIGLVACDSVDAVGAFLLFDGDLPDNAESFQKLSPVEWSSAHGASFADLNVFLEALFADSRLESDLEYTKRLKEIFDSCAEAFERLRLKSRYRESLYITFSGTDPNDLLVAAEKDFVRRMNSSDTFQEWCRELE